MVVVGQSSPFGSQTRTRALLALWFLETSYARELARVLGISLLAVQKALTSLERDGLVAARAVGRTRQYRISPSYFAQAELRQYLRRLAEPEAQLRESVEQLRRRPRRAGKRL